MVQKYQYPPNVLRNYFSWLDMSARIISLVILFMAANGQQQDCTDAVSGLNWIGYPSCDTIFGRGHLNPEYSKLSHIKPLKFNLRTSNFRLPVEYSVLDVQEYVIYSSQFFAGVIPPQFSTWTNLEKFQLHHDYSNLDANCNIASEFSEWRKLQEFSIVNHTMNGSIPAQISTWKNVQKFQITVYEKESFKNFITGQLAVEFSEWGNLKFLDVGNNNITGTLPEEFSNWSTVVNINLQNNNLVGVLPEEYSTWEQLSDLQLQNQLLDQVCAPRVLYDQFSSKINTENLPACTSNPEEVDILLAFKNQLSNPELLSSWVGSQPCTWDHIICKGGQINEIKLVMDTTNQIPPQFSTLKSLAILSFQNVKVFGTIPFELSVLNVEIFELSNHEMQGGTLPPQFSTWSGIKIFDISTFNSTGKLTGPIPGEYSTWTNLETFDVGNNKFSGTLSQQYSTWTKLDYFDVKSNNISGTLPVQFSAWSPFQNQEIFVQFGNNQLSGSVPNEFYNWKGPSLFFQPQKGNRLCISTFLTNQLFNSFETTDVENLPNCFNFELNESQEVEALQAFHDSQIFCIYARGEGHFKDSYFTEFESFPNCFGLNRYQSLDPFERMYISNNNNYIGREYTRMYIRNLEWEGTSACKQNWTGIECSNGSVISIDFNWWNSVAASIPPQFSLLKNLQKIKLTTYNANYGAIPVELSTLTNLQEFTLQNFYRSDLTYSLPVQFSTWTNLKIFSLSNEQMPNLTLYNLSNGYVEGQLYEQYSVWEKLEYFDVGNNKFQGTLPQQYSVWKNLVKFNVSKNTLSGTLPLQYSVWQNLEEFSVDENLLSGTLPQQYSLWQNLDKFILSQNNFQDILPEQFSVWEMLDTFYISNNSLTGTLPRQFSRWGNRYESDEVDYFDLSYNFFIGSIPVEFLTENFARTLKLFPQKNNGIFLIPQNNSDFCLSRELQIFIEKYLPENLENVPAYSGCDDVLFEIGNALDMYQKMSWAYNWAYKIPCRFKQVNCGYGRNFEYQLSSNRKVFIPDSSRLMANIKLLLQHNANVTGLEPDYQLGVNKEAVITTLLDFGKKVKDSFSQSSFAKRYQDYFTTDDPCDWWYVSCYRKEVVGLSFKFSDDNITFSIPPEFSNIKYLEYIRVKAPYFVTGTIPVELSVLQSMQNFEIRGEVRGTLPVQFSTWQFLVDFKIQPKTQISRSLITGSLPEQYSMWINLRSFEVFRSSLSGSLVKQFSTWNNPIYYNTIRLHDNQLSGSLPLEYSAWVNLTQFDISGNQLTGTLSPQFSVWAQNLQWLNISHNLIDTNLPNQFSVFKNNDTSTKILL